MTKDQKIQALVGRGVEDVIVRNSVLKKLRSGKKLRVKLGVDPTSPQIHLGHSVVLRKLRAFQELGHTAIFLVGDFTARIGDPSDKLSARKALTEAQVRENMQTYRQQVGKILDLQKVEFRYNSEWHKQMDFAELFQLMSLFTVNHMLERDMFQERLKQRKPLWLHELLYPVLQGYDSVALKADIELGGTDQTFNMLTARTIQPYYHQEPQDVMTVQLLEGTDGTKKMSKSIGNVITFSDSAADVYGKTMSIPDTLIIKYFRLLTDVADKDIAEYERQIKTGGNPKTFKEKLALELVTMYHGAKAAATAQADFVTMFQKKTAPGQLQRVKVSRSRCRLLDLLVDLKLVPSKSEGRRLITQGGVQIDGTAIMDWQQEISVKDGMVVRVGKRTFVRLVK